MCACWHFWHLPRELPHSFPRPLHLPFGLRHAHMILSWNRVSFDVPMTGRATAAESSPSPRPRPGRLAGQDRPGRHGSAASLPCGSGVAPPRSQPKLRRLRPRLRSQVSPPAHTHKHVPHERPTLHAAMSGGDGLPPSSLGIAGRPEEAAANNTWGKPLILTYTNRGMRHVGEAPLTNRGSATWITGPFTLHSRLHHHQKPLGHS